MAIHFSRDRMEAVAHSHSLWWDGKLDRALVRGCITDYHSPSHISSGPVLTMANCHDFSISPRDLIDAEDARLSTCEYFADGYPVMDFAPYGPGLLAAMLGCRLDNSTGQVWLHPCCSDLSKLDIRYDPENPWSRRIKDIYQAGLERWQGEVIMTLPDLGGVMDILASMIGTEQLIFALVDEPELVRSSLDRIQTAWYEAYRDFADTLKPQGLYTDWNGLLSREPGYILQCDFSYMLGPDMFREFVMPTLRRDMKQLHNTIYHLDGIGAKKHLRQLLSLPELKAVQWVYGVDQEGPHAWLDVYRQILDAGKQIMIIENAMHNGYGAIRSHLGPSPHVCIWAVRDEMEEAFRLANL